MWEEASPTQTEVERCITLLRKAETARGVLLSLLGLYRKYWEGLSSFLRSSEKKPFSQVWDRALLELLPFRIYGVGRSLLRGDYTEASVTQAVQKLETMKLISKGPKEGASLIAQETKHKRRKKKEEPLLEAAELFPNLKLTRLGYQVSLALNF